MQFQRGTNIFAADAGRRRLSPGRRGHVCLLLAILFLCVLMMGAASAAPWNGDVNTTWFSGECAAGHTGSSGNPFLIYDEKSLAAFANETNNNQTQDGFSTKHILLMKNLDLNGTVHNWYPIGNTTEKQFPSNKIFKGTFDGDNHTISNMTVNVTRSSTDERAYAGLFGYVMDATIENVRLENASVNATSSSFAFAGGLVGLVFDKSTIENCYATDEVNATSVPNFARAGGLVGYTSGSITASGSITNCYATGNVTASGLTIGAQAGGLVGEAYANTITNSTALNPWVNASGGGTIKIGWVVGQGSASSCYAWRHMGLNISGTIVKPVPAGGNNATNASTVMIWGNETFFENELGWTFGTSGNWTMGTDHAAPRPTD